MISLSGSARRETGRLADAAYDLLVIGGGIVGAGVARDAALRGLRVALVDQADFASGTSSRSSKLVHGGLRYLEHAAFRLVREACVERHVLLNIAPHLVRPLPLVFPCYRGGGRPMWKVRAGLFLYDLFAGRRIIRKRKMLSAVETLKSVRGLRSEGLSGAGLYYDCRMDDSRLCLENILDAARAGAVAVNYAKVVSFSKRNGVVTGAVVQDIETGDEIVIRASVTVNATGPWADAIRRIDDPASAPAVRRTKGIHLVTRELSPGLGIAATARSDGRMFFVLPFLPGYSLVGTTDTDSAEDPAIASVESGEVDYLLSEAASLFPESNIGRTDVVSCFAGLRTLVRSAETPAAASREYVIEQSRSGLLSVIGGKFTTYRAMSERIVNRVMKRLGRPKGECLTAESLSSAKVLGPDSSILDARYGFRSHAAGQTEVSDGENMGEISAGCGVTWREARYAIREESARRPMDFLRRRTPYCLIRPPDCAVLARLCGIFQRELGWTNDTRSTREREALTEWNRYRLV